MAAIGTNHGAGPTVALRALRGWRGAGHPARRAPEHRSREPRGRPGRVPALDPGLLRRVRRAGRRRSERGSSAAVAARRRRRSRPSASAFDAGRAPVAGRSRSTSPSSCSRRPPARGRRVSNAPSARAWVVSVELDPPKGGSLDGLVEIARAIHASGHVGFVDVNDNPMARARMNALMSSATLQREAGIETIPHVTPRDSTVMGLEGRPARRARGGGAERPGGNGRPAARRRLPRVAGRLRGRLDRAGAAPLVPQPRRGLRRQGASTRRPRSSSASPSTRPPTDLELELERFRAKIDAGAHFAMTQALFDVDLLDRFAERFGGRGRSRARRRLAAAEPRDGAAAAQRGARDQRSRTPCSMRSRTAGADAPAVGLELARELVEGARTRAAGIYVIPPFKQPTAALDLFA